MRSVHLQFLPETMNRCWAESDEAAMLAVHRRNRQVNESKLKFQVSNRFYLIYSCRKRGESVGSDSVSQMKAI